MQTTASRGRSSFGMECIECTNSLIAPEKSEYRDERQVAHQWHCPKCGCSFEVISPADIRPIKEMMRRIKDVVARRDASQARLVA